jgi:hypothetical protein
MAKSKFEIGQTVYIVQIDKETKWGRMDEFKITAMGVKRGRIWYELDKPRIGENGQKTEQFAWEDELSYMDEAKTTITSIAEKTV